MKIQVMKLFLTSALSLAITASFMGNSATAQAARDKGASPLWTCDHYWSWTGDSRPAYEASNSEYHYVSEEREYKCGVCADYCWMIEKQTGYEKHDLIAADWPHRYECTICGYKE